MGAFKTNNISTMISLGAGETLLESKRVHGCAVYLTTGRLIIFNDIGFGDEVELLNTRLDAVESVTSSRESPWLFYCLGALFCLSSLVPAIFAGLTGNGFFFWPVLLTPVALAMGMAFVAKNCFMRRALHIQLKTGKLVRVADELQPVLEKAFPIRNERDKAPLSRKIKGILNAKEGFDLQYALERLLS